MTNGIWQKNNFTEKRDFQDDIQDFYRYSNYTTNLLVNPKTKELEPEYFPDYDFFGPYFLYPMACYSMRGMEYGYPIIGYVKNDNEVERALIDEYSLIFK